MKISIRSQLPNENYIIKIILALLIGIILGVSFFLHPENLPVKTCYFHDKTGLSCPTCGLTRSFYSFSHLQFVEAFQFHIMGPIILIVVLFFELKWMFEIVAKKEIQINIDPTFKKYALFLFVSIWFLFFLVRIVNELTTIFKFH